MRLDDGKTRKRRYQRVKRDGSPWVGSGDRMEIIEVDKSDVLFERKAFMNTHYHELEVPKDA